MKNIFKLFTIHYSLFIISLLTVHCSLFTVYAQQPGQQPISSQGKDFWMAFLDNYDSGMMDTVVLKVYITSQYNASGTISLPLLGWSQAFSVGANQGIVVYIPKVLATADTTEVIQQKGIHIVADNFITAWAVNDEDASTDATNILPSMTIGENPQYIVASYYGLRSGTAMPSEFIIVSTEDGTQVSITPSTNTLGGKSANVTFNITLNQGETYQVKAQDTCDLTGSLVSSSSGSFCLFSGVVCAFVPYDCSSCDHVYKQCFPVNSWGEQYIITPLMFQAGGYLFRIIASQDNTTVTIPGQPNVSLNKGNNFTFDQTSPVALYISADKPISVVQFMKGGACNGYSNNGVDDYDGDPAMLILNSNNQLQFNAVFEVASTPVVDSLVFLNVIIQTDNINSITLDGSNIAPSNFTQVPSLTNYSYATLETHPGTHVLISESGFIAYAYGVGTAESYMYGIGGGNAVYIYIAANENPVCKGVPVTFTAEGINGGTSPVYQWKVNGVNQGTNSNIFTYTPANDDTVKCILTSNEPQATGNPATSNIVFMRVNDCKNGTLFLPNAFAPGKGILNTMFLPDGKNIGSFSMDIYNRWGSKVFHSDNLSSGWDGTCNGQLCPFGVYCYFITYQDYMQTHYVKKTKLGTITLIR